LSCNSILCPFCLCARAVKKKLLGISAGEISKRAAKVRRVRAESSLWLAISRSLVPVLVLIKINEDTSVDARAKLSREILRTSLRTFQIGVRGTDLITLITRHVSRREMRRERERERERALNE